MWFTALFPIFSSLIERLIPDPVAQEQAKTAMQQALNEAAATQEKATADEMVATGNVVTQEMKGQNVWLANWRACLMLMIVAMIANQWIISPILVPILSYFHLTYAVPAFPNDAWTLLTVGLGGYIGKEAVIAHHKGKLATAQANSAAVSPSLTDKIYFDALRDVKGSALTTNEVNAGNKVLAALKTNLSNTL